MANVIILILLAFLSGSIPFGQIIAKKKKIDLKKHGSGNIGATNAFRVLGKKSGALVLFLDALKGALPIIMASIILPSASKLDYTAFGIAAILGHIFTPWQNWKGGKGVATAAGVLAALLPLGLGLGVILFIFILKTTQFVSLGSISAALGILSYRIFLDKEIYNIQPFSNQELPITILVIATFLIVIITHKENIKRLLNGTENKIKI